MERAHVLEYEAVLYPEATQPLIPRSIDGLCYPPEIADFLEAGFFTNCDDDMKKEFAAERIASAADLDLVRKLACRVFAETRLDERNQPSTSSSPPGMEELKWCGRMPSTA